MAYEWLDQHYPSLWLSSIHSKHQLCFSHYTSNQQTLSMMDLICFVIIFLTQILNVPVICSVHSSAISKSETSVERAPAPEKDSPGCNLSSSEEPWWGPKRETSVTVCFCTLIKRLRWNIATLKKKYRLQSQSRSIYSLNFKLQSHFAFKQHLFVIKVWLIPIKLD